MGCVRYTEYTRVFYANLSYSEFSKIHPLAKVTAVDIVTLGNQTHLPKYVPVNLDIQVDDVNKGWTFPKGRFDYVHARAVNGHLDNVCSLYQNAYW